nr:MAG TPA: minor tail protein [Caudoviricetes sp.]
MANADGSVIFSCDLDSTKAQKKLSKLRDEISELNSKLEKETGNKMNLEKQLDAASQAAKATEERVKMLRKEVERLNDREWIQKQGFTQNEYQTQVLDRRAAAEAELKQQEALLHTQTKEVKTLSAAYEETTANIDSMTVKLDKAKVAAGEMIANVEQERKEREAENSALAKAGQYAARFRDQVKSLARSMLVFSVITAALMALRKQIKAAIATSAEAADAFARLKGALLTLAAPLMDVLIPALTWLMNLLAAIVSEIVTIISILSGKSKKSMEASGKNLYKEAAAIDATGKAAKEATDALAAFDEINKLSTTTSVGGGGGASAIAPDFDFDEGPMMEKLDKVFQKINDIFKTIRAGLEIVVDDLKWSFDKKAIPKSKATWLTVLTALLGATLGAAFGGITGGVIGLSLGVLLGLYLVGLDPETWKTEMDAEDAWIVVITALLGALLGSVFLGITGGVAGFSLGAILGLYLTGFAEGDEEHGGKSQLLSELIVVLCALLGAVIGSIVTPGVGTVVGMGLGLILGLSIYSVRKDPKKGTQRLVSIGRSVLLGLLAGVLGVGLAALGIVSAGTAFIISAAIGLALKFFVDSVDDSKVRKATSGFTGTRVSTKAPARSRRVAAQSLDGNAPAYNEIPALASGAVIPPNRKFLAVLGDQKSGTNVEAPLSTIKQAVMEAMAQGSREPINVNLVVDGKTLARVVVPNINNMTRAAGKPVLLY